MPYWGHFKLVVYEMFHLKAIFKPLSNYFIVLNNKHHGCFPFLQNASLQQISLPYHLVSCCDPTNAKTINKSTKV